MSRSNLTDEKLREILQAALIYGGGEISRQVHNQIMAKEPTDPLRQWLEDTIAQGAIHVG